MQMHVGKHIRNTVGLIHSRNDSARILGANKHADRMTTVLTVRDDGAKLPILFIIRGGAGDRIEKNKLN
ncbi:hypothetical protein F441_04991 [Phytophthora nicotianae CJ01A1]|uniref:DDE-1 domain-containing protein n=1 Tax=Phytophthora nicotianae CJ01A1 TaxID=1317063 RepID=W2XG84_PHYNI|nr:hypothetical protein F441_04991 [Phytophthora nicotianae CJ01A1]